MLKLLDSFDGLLERDGIASFVRCKHQSLLKDFGEDLHQVPYCRRRMLPEYNVALTLKHVSKNAWLVRFKLLPKVFVIELQHVSNSQ